jgi:hypothetical protein
MNKLINYLGFALTLLFVWAAYVQLNDPDAGLWVALYLLAAAGTFLFTINRVPYWVGFLLAILYAGLAVYYWPDAYEGVKIGGGDINNIERGRESLGMGITALIFLIFGIARR